MDIRDELEDFFEDVKEKLEEHDLEYIHERAQRTLDDAPDAQDIKQYIRQVIQDLGQLHYGVEDLTDTVEDIIGFDMELEQFDLTQSPGELYEEFQQRYEQLFDEVVDVEMPDVESGLSDLMDSIGDASEYAEDIIENAQPDDSADEETVRPTMNRTGEEDDRSVSLWLIVGIAGGAIALYWFFNSGD